jgi:hypothetical protein
MCPFADQLTAVSCRSIVAEISNTLCLQPLPIRLGFWIYLCAFETSMGLRHCTRFSHLSRQKRIEILEGSRFPAWGLVCKALGTLVSLNAFDYVNIQDAADASKRAK